VAVAAFPQSATGESNAHIAAAAIAFPALSLWPALTWQRGGRPGRVICLTAASALLGLLGWFGVEFFGGGPRIGLSERVLAGTQSMWPLAAALLARRR
jgi:hypothetical protein